jgi:phosphoglycerate dehydrogenase-like enzyme
MANRTPPKVVVLQGETRPPGMASVHELATVRYATAGELPDALPGAGAWQFADRLRWAHIASVGVDRLLFDDLVDSEVVVTNSRGVFDQAIADYVLALVLCFAKQLHVTLRLQAQRRWQHRETESVAGARALVVGTGPIGRAIGRRLAGVGMAVAGVGRTARSADPDLGEIAPLDHLPDAVASADYVVLVAPLTDRSAGMIDASVLARMRSTARLINVGRGGLVVQGDLVDALRTGGIAGAALDVFEEEPLPPDSPLWDLPNVLISPHMSGDLVGWRDELVELFVANLARYRAGEPLRNVVDKRLGYVPTDPKGGR